MNFCFKRREPLALGFVRIAREEIEGALADLGADSGSPPDDDGIHEARRRLKKLRALLRLMRSALGGEELARANSAAREVAHSLAPARDAAVQLATLDGLLDAFAGRNIGKWSALRRRIAGALPPPGQTKRDAARVNAVIVRLRELLATIEPAPVEDDAALIRNSLRRAYGRARRRLAAAKADASDEMLHRLRKRVKDVYHHVLLVRRAAPERCRRLLRRLDRLGDHLGLDHDLAVLAHALTSGIAIDEEALDELRAHLDLRRRKHQRAAFRLAKELLSEKPSDWLKPFARAWERWHEPS